MLGKSFIWFVMVAFLCLAISPAVATAQAGLGGSAPPSIDAADVVIMTAVLVGILALFFWHANKEEKKDKSQQQKQEDTDSLNYQHPDERFVSPSGQIALYRW